jgi:hypothetical protein
MFLRTHAKVSTTPSSLLLSSFLYPCVVRCEHTTMARCDHPTLRSLHHISAGFPHPAQSPACPAWFFRNLWAIWPEITNQTKRTKQTKRSRSSGPLVEGYLGYKNTLARGSVGLCFLKIRKLRENPVGLVFLRLRKRTKAVGPRFLKS